ncbi:MAG: serine/threonine-protein kinase [Polyangiaceae bacterium]
MGKLQRLKDGKSARVGHYELFAELAVGGMGTVYLARTNTGDLSRLYAIKVMHPHLCRDEEFVAMFRDEARLATRLSHPNLVTHLEAGQSDRGPYIVMEYVEGPTLARLLSAAARSESKGLSHAAVVRIVLDVLAGLHEAHELRDENGRELDVVHRDVSPQNILIDMRSGVSRLTDFGVARAAARLTETRTGQIKGKFSYMAPEQAEGKAVDRRTDVFAAAILLWEGLARQRFFKGESDAQILVKLLGRTLQPIGEVVNDCPPELDVVCMKALARKPSDRYSSAREFAEALEAAARAVGVLSKREVVRAEIETLLGADLAAEHARIWSWARDIPSEPLLVDDGPDNPVTRVDTPAARSSTSSAHLETGGAMQMSGSPPPLVRARNRLIWAMLALCIAGSVFLVIRNARREKAAAAAAAAALLAPSGVPHLPEVVSSGAPASSLSAAAPKKEGEVPVVSAAPSSTNGAPGVSASDAGAPAAGSGQPAGKTRPHVNVNAVPHPQAPVDDLKNPYR